jgi:general secretion pathway protein L
MKADLYIELPSAPDGPLRLARWRGSEIEHVPLGRAAANSRTRAIAFAPALCVAKLRVPVAAKSQFEARKAALYAVEDDLAQPVEDVHLTLGPKVKNEAARDVYIVDRGLMRAWTDALAALNLDHAAIIPENSLSLPQGAMLDFGDRLLLSHDGSAVAADTAWPDEALRELISACGLGHARRIQANALETLIPLQTNAPGIALEGADGDAARRRAGKGLGRWLFAGALALAAAGLWLASVWFETSGLQQAADRNEAAARAAYRAQFPGAPEPADIGADVRRLSAQLVGGAPAGFRTLSAALYGALPDSPSVRVISLTYTRSESALRTRIQLSTRAEEAGVRSRLEASGFLAETESVIDLPAGVEASLIVRAAP